MSSLGTSKGILEIAKFGVYVTVPIILMYTFANNSSNLRKFMGNVFSLIIFSYLIYNHFGFMYFNLCSPISFYWY